MALRLGSSSFGEHELIVMAIINRTPDSFFDKGSNYANDAALDAVDQALADGADIIDIGGVKAGPGDTVDAAEEIRRTVDFVASVRARHPAAVISVDTWRSEVAGPLCAAGADLLNDAWGGHDPLLASVAAEHDVGLVCTHTGGAAPRTRPHRVTYDHLTGEVMSFLTAETQRAVALGVDASKILVDPGHDFGKNTWHSLQITRDLEQLVSLGWPVLVSLSNKDFIGETLNRPVSDRLVGTLAVTAVSAWLGARVFRVHQSDQTVQVLQMVAALRGWQPPAVARRGLA